MIIDIINVPIWCGCGKKGTELAPNYIANNVLLELINDSKHKIGSIINIPSYEPNKEEENRLLKYGETVYKYCYDLANAVHESLCNGRFPIILGGDHSLSIGSITGVKNYLENEDLSVVWVDAHTDINTKLSSDSHNIHGMPLSFLANIENEDNDYRISKKERIINPKDIYYLGSRSVDNYENKIIEKYDITSFSNIIIKEKGLNYCLDEISKRMNKNKLHLSLDVDFFDKDEFYATGLPIEYGHTIDDAINIIKHLASNHKILSFDLVEYVPSLDINNECLFKLKRVLKTLLDCLG